MGRFRIKQNDTINASVFNSESGKMLASLYDSGFTTIRQIESALLRKIPYTSAKKIDFSIVNRSEEKSKFYTKKLNN